MSDTTAPAPGRAKTRAAMAFVPLVLVNAISMAAQFQFWRSHLAGWNPAEAAMFAVALESIAIYVAYHAHTAMLEDDSSAALRFASYGLGLVVGGLNGSHYVGPHGQLTAAAIGLGLLSASSPWLWGLHSKRQSRGTLRAKGLIEPRSVRLGMTRWLWHPVRSARVFWAASWIGVQDPAEAIALIEPRADSARAVADFEPETLADMTTLADAIRFAMLEVARARNVALTALTAREITEWLEDHKGELAEPWSVTASYVSDVIRRTMQTRERQAGNVTRLRQSA